MVTTTTGTLGDDRLSGDHYDSLLRRIDYNDIIYGLAGDDVISGGRGADYIYGGAGNDTIYGLNQMSSLEHSGRGYLYGEAGDDRFIIYSQGNTVDGGTGNDTLVLAPSSALWVSATLGEGTAFGSAQAHEAPGSIRPDHFLLGVEFKNIENVVGTGFDDTITGNSAANRLEGRYGDDTLFGGGGGDVLVPGGGGHDALYGGSGVDTLEMGSGGTISLSISGAQTVGTLSTLRLDSIENIRGSGNNDTLTGSVFGNVLEGNGGNDKLYGLNGDDLLRGGLGMDLLDGGVGDDFLDGGAGADEMWGGIGNDRFVVDDAGDRIIEPANGGADTVLSAISYALGAGVSVETIMTADALAATAINLTGNELANVLAGNAGANALSGGGGNDRLHGGGGDDRLAGGDNDDTLDGGWGDDRIEGGLGSDTVTYAGAASRVEVDLARTLGQNTRGAGIDTLSSIENAVGSAFNDRLTGTPATNRLNGGGGADVLIGGGGSDVLTGGTGGDRFVYLALSNSTAAAPDAILDLGQGDRIDLSRIDANRGAAGNQAFHLGATAGHVGDVVLAFHAAINWTALLLFVDGDAVADATIWLTGDRTTLTVADFVL